jgi:lipopolysaccharide/colanic/teichoic acid biosynthesis glycosyltransferase
LELPQVFRMAGQTTSLATYPQKLRAPSAWDSTQRLLDVILVIAASPVWVPLLLLIMVVKLVVDGRPVLFHHVRLGLNGEPFVLHKIRTTPPDFRPQPDDWSDGDFPPRTRLGSWLRRFDLDELPQLWNVIQGEMSLVGPRPEMPAHASTFSCRIPEFTARLAVRPGLTGLAQVRGWRGNTSIRQRLHADLKYLESRGAAKYFRILLSTVRLEVRGLREMN